MIIKSFLDLSKKTILVNGRREKSRIIFNNYPLKFFANKSLESLQNVLKSEINHEENNYSPVDQNELITFFNKTKFEFKEKENSIDMELRKTQGNFELIINFQAKAPTLEDDVDQKQDDSQDKSKNINKNFSAGISKRVTYQSGKKGNENWNFSKGLWNRK
jgi:hypothetical protein